MIPNYIILIAITLLGLWGVSLKLYIKHKMYIDSTLYNNKPITKFNIKQLRLKQNKLANAIITLTIISLLILILLQS